MKIRKPDLAPSPVNEEHENHGLPPVEQVPAMAAAHPVLRTATWFTAITLSAITLYLMARLFLPNMPKEPLRKGRDVVHRQVIDRRGDLAPAAGLELQA